MTSFEFFSLLKCVLRKLLEKKLKTPNIKTFGEHNTIHHDFIDINSHTSLS